MGNDLSAQRRISNLQALANLFRMGLAACEEDGLTNAVGASDFDAVGQHLGNDLVNSVLVNQLRVDL